MEHIQIAINDHRKIFAVQEAFNSLLPNLKLEFFSKPHTKDGKHPDKINKEPGHTIGDCRTSHHPGQLVINPEMSVSDLEQVFQDVYGLKIRVMQRSQNDWLDITDNSLPLRQYNRELTA